MTYSLYANNDEFIQTNDIGLFQTKPPILKYVTEGTTTVSYQTYTSIIGVTKDENRSQYTSDLWDNTPSFHIGQVTNFQALSSSQSALSNDHYHIS